MRRFVFIIPALCSVQVFSQQILDPPAVTPQNPPKAVVTPYVREADMMWAKRIWRLVDMRQKMNQVYYFPLEPQNTRINLISLIQAGIREGKITAYDPNYGDEFKKALDNEKALMVGCKSDTLLLQEANPPYNYVSTAITTPFDPSSVTKFKIKEDWFFDRQRSIMTVRILGICPIMNVYDAESGELKGEMEMYWIDYAQARSFFSQYEIYNRYNFAQSISYDDAFQVRLFSSTILKEDNVHDRYIASYMDGEDAVLEAEEIKKKLMLYESDLWEY